MTENQFLVLLLIGAAVVILVLWNRVSALSKDMHGQATSMFERWKYREYESVRRDEAERATQAAAVQLEQWKLGAEKGIRQDAVTRSQAVTVGKVAEHIAPYLPNFRYNPKDARFIGTPVDFIVFDGLSEGSVSRVVFIEIKSGSSTLSSRERQVRDAVRAGSVQWEELRVSPAALT